MRIDIITLFPGMFQGPLTESILQRASTFAPAGATADRQDDTKPIQIHLHDLREFGEGTHRQVDDAPYGGGVGMVLRADVVVKAIEKISEKGKMTLSSNERSGAERVERLFDSSSLDEVRDPSLEESGPHRIYLSARGEVLQQEKVESLASHHQWLILLCGHYEGIDQRIIDGGWIDEEISIGEYVLTGGEIPAMVLIDAVARHIPGVLGKEESSAEESYSAALNRKREYPHYTRPEEFRNLKVPDVLLSGHHAEIEKWRKNNCS